MKALELLKEIEAQKPFIYRLTRVWCRAVVVNEPNKIKEAISELEELQKINTCIGCKWEGKSAALYPCMNCIRSVDTDHYKQKEKDNKYWKMTKQNKKYFNDNFGNEIINSENGTVKYQSRNYIEDGFYIIATQNDFILFEIPLYGGYENELGKFKDINSLIEYAKTLY